MNFSVEISDGEPIVIFQLKSGYKFARDISESQTVLDEAISQFNSKIVLITDFSNVSMEFSDMVIKLSEDTNGKPGSLSDPRIRRNVFIGNDDMVDLAAQSLQQTQYGKVDVMIFRDLDTALEFSRAILR